MALNFIIPTSGGAYTLPGPDTLDFWIRDLLPNAPIVTPASFGVADNVPIGTSVGTVVATDADEETLTFAIVAGNTGSAFAIDSGTGEITTAAALNYNDQPNYSLTVRATDPGGLYGSATITVALTSTGPAITPATFSVGEFAELGTLVGTVEATDPDGDDFTFAISSGNTGGAFAIDSVSGALTVAAELDYETKPLYSLVIIATDTTGRWGTATITVEIIDEIEIVLPPPPALIQGLGLSWGRTQSLDAETWLAWQQTQVLDVTRMLRWQRAQRLDVQTSLAWRQTLPVDLQSAMRWSETLPLDVQTDLLWQQTLPLDLDRAMRWGETQPADVDLTMPWRSTIPTDRGLAMVYSDFDPHAPAGTWFSPEIEVQPGAGVQLRWPRPGLNFHVRGEVPYQLPGPTTLDFHALEFELWVAVPPVALRWAPFRAPSIQSRHCDVDIALPWARAVPLDRDASFRSEPTVPVPGEDTGLPWRNDPPDYVQIVVPPLTVYNVLNSISVVRLPERTPINPIGLSLSYDDSTYCWTATLVLFDAAEVALLKPSATITREIEVTVNGFVVVLAVENRSRERAYPAQRWTLQCKGRQAYLDAPYAQTRSYMSTGLASAAQHALDELPPGWTLTWDAVDWAIPAGAWSYTNLTPMKAISRLASAIGAVIEPDPEDQHITVRSRYPISPREWSTTTPAIVLPDALCSRMGDRDVPSEVKDAVIVQASRAPGHRVKCTRFGESGDTPLPLIVEELCTAYECGAERGRVELDATGWSVDSSIALPIIESLGVVLPGQLIEVEEGESSWRGLSRSVAIAAARTGQGWSIGQTVRIERRDA
jgi:hypothetical protein